MKTALSILTALALSVIAAPALDRYDALSEIETQNNDRQIGPQHEVSRYQILPELWAQAWSDEERAVVRATDPAAAKIAVQRIMQTRCGSFENRYHHTPDDFEFYILWHRPACYIGRTTPRPITALEAGRARRFANLCQNGDTIPLAGNASGKILSQAPLIAQSPRS